MLDTFFKNIVGKNFPKSFKKSFSTVRTGNAFTLKNTDFGKINVECDLIRRIVERAVGEIEGIHEVSAIIEPPTDKLSLAVRFSLVLEQNYSVQSISEKLSEVTQKNLKEIFQIVDEAIFVKVTGIMQTAEKKKGRRVR